MSKTIPLSKGEYAVVDDDDYELVSRFKWHLCVSGSRKVKYAHCRMSMGRIGGKYHSCTMWLHRLIMRPSEDMEVDHQDHNGLNCCRDNMRLANRAQNGRNIMTGGGMYSPFKGAVWNKVLQRWSARIKYNGKNIHLGYCKSATEAAHVYDNAAIKYFGEFACLNFPDQRVNRAS